IGVLTRIFSEKSLEETLDYFQSLGLEAVEFGAGAYLRTAHFPTEELLANESKVRWLKQQIGQRGIEITALSCHGNPLHPNSSIATAHRTDFVNTCRLARRLDVAQVNTLSGCPGTEATARLPSWIVCPFPEEDFLRVWEWQWSERVIPY